MPAAGQRLAGISPAAPRAVLALGGISGLYWPYEPVSANRCRIRRVMSKSLTALEIRSSPAAPSRLQTVGWIGSSPVSSSFFFREHYGRGHHCTHGRTTGGWRGNRCRRRDPQPVEGLPRLLGASESA